MARARCLFCGREYSDYDEHLRYSCDGGFGKLASAIEPASFDGETYEPTRDHDRLNAQLSRVFDVMRDHAWHTLADVARLTGDPEASVSARLRDLRKDKFGGHTIERRYLDRGLHEYRLIARVAVDV